MAESLPPDSSLLATQRRTVRLRNALLAAAVVAAVWGVAARLNAQARLSASTRTSAITVVTIVQPKAAAAAEALDLPGTAAPWVEAAIYARTSGYLRGWKVDIGAHVRRGDLLAEIDTPEVDAQWRQATADLASAKAAADIAHTTNVRWQGLLAQGAVSPQDAEQKAADDARLAAAHASAAANLARLQELESFRVIRAPFNGVITQRTADVGGLINAGQTAGMPLFKIADMHRLRIYAAVPERDSHAIHVGTTAEIRVAGRPQPYKAAVTATAEAIDPTSRTLQVELQLDNTHNDLLGGAYTTVHFALDGAVARPRVPVTSLLFRGDGLWVATLPDGHHVALRHVVPGRDFGTEIEIEDGISSTDTVVSNPPDSLADGDEVRVAAPAKAH